MKTKTRLQASAVTVGLLALAACGSDDDTTPSEPTQAGPGTTTSPQEDSDSDTATAGGDVSADSKVAQIQESGELVVGTKFSAPPFGFRDPGSGEVQGFMPDVSRELADKLGVEVKFVEATVDNRIPLLQEGAVDLSVDTMVITCERAEQIDFTRPYYLSQARVLTRKDSGLTELEDFNDKTVGTPAGSYMIPAFEEAAPDVEFNFIDDYAQMGQLLAQGQLDGVTSDDTILTGLIVQNDDLHLVGDSLGEGPYGIGVAKENPELLDFVNGEIDRMLEDGTWTSIYEEWVQKYTNEPPVDPSGVSLEDALALNPCS